MRKALLLTSVGIAGFLAAIVLANDTRAAPRAAAAPAWFRLHATVTRVVDGDTLRARVAGKSESVRLLGIDAPEVGAGGAAGATAEIRALTSRPTVVLVGDRSQAKRDRYGRLLAYVTLPGGSDLGERLVAGGHAAVYVYGGKPFARAAGYRAAEAMAKTHQRGQWGLCGGGTPTPPPTAPVAPPPTVAPPTTTATPTTATSCDPSYPDFCIPPPPPDLDCRDISRKSFRVLQPDPHRFDGNKDGVGCEN